MDFTSMDRAALRDYATTDDLLDLIEGLRAERRGDTQDATQTEATPEAEPLVFMYTNWRGESGLRRAHPRRVYWGSTDWHPAPQWLMEALDADKQAVRVFAMQDMMPYTERTVQIDCPDVETGRAAMVGFHMGKALVWTHSQMEHRLFDLSYVRPLTS